MAYQFKQITIVPTATEFIDIILSKTQRKTPTVIHPGYKISRIRTFYLRKVKFTQQNYHDKITAILDSFPKLDVSLSICVYVWKNMFYEHSLDVHPFYAELMNVLYDRDHYKIALGQLSTARKLIDNVGKDYSKLLKYGDSLYRCKQLKRAALGRMCTIMKRQASSLAYLEQVRQHLSRIPNIDPVEKTLILTGFPNVGKSSFMKTVTRADVDVQPYPFTTKSLFIGHLDYGYQRWQVMDTPGILDHALEERNTIEMQAITALAHLKACVLYLMDVSEECGHNLEQQINLFNSIKVLFSNKPVVLVLNKIDLIRPEDLPEKTQAALKKLGEDNPNVTMMTMSSLTGENVTEVKTKACEVLLAKRVQQEVNSGKVNKIMNQLTVAFPEKRDNVHRPVCIPQSVIEKLPNPKKVNGEKTLHQRYVDDCEDFQYDWREEHILADEEWRFDDIPQIMDGKNIADFIDPDILEKLEQLENEEEMRIQQGFYEFEKDEDDRDEDVVEFAKKVRQKREKLITESRLKKTKTGSRMPRMSFKQSEFKSHMQSMGIQIENDNDNDNDGMDLENVPIKR
eukprot:Pgem_evm1s4060